MIPVKEGYKRCAGCGGLIPDDPKWDKCQRCMVPRRADESERAWVARQWEKGAA